MKKNIIYVIFILFFIFSGCSGIGGNVEIKEKDIVALCNVVDDYCREDYLKFKDDVVKLEDEDILIIYVQTDCCAPFDVNSVNKVDNKVIVEVIEKGDEVCQCGANLQKIRLRINETVSLENLEIWHIKEYDNSKNLIYPKK